MTPGARSAEVAISAREAEVLAAVGEHLTNAEIAARLFISTRTVESHVSSLLRKLGVDDRRALALVAARRVAAGRGAATPPVAGLPRALTPFVGRVAERAALGAALGEHRLVTAVGPGGIGKTRLAAEVAADLAEEFADGVFFVDLVPVAEPSMIGATVADVLGLGEHHRRSVEESVADWLAERRVLLVLDNCEHLLDGVVVLLERLLAGCPRVGVLATSRARLLVPFEWVFMVPGMSIEAADGPGDAVELFLGRAAAGGALPTDPDPARVAAMCRSLDGMALAIELAAARFAALGIDGLEAGLEDRLRLLAGGSRIDDRHRSLRSALDWSHALLGPEEQAVLRRVSVFAGAFDASAAATLVGDWSPVSARAVPALLAGLVEQSLVIAVTGSGGTRYRVLETIRQYGAERLDENGEATEVAWRHLRWCLDAGRALDRRSDASGGAWRTDFDELGDELRAALSWSAVQAPERPDAFRAALTLGNLTFRRGLLAESQRRYEQAADLAPDDRARADALRRAAGAAESRHVGIDALRLRRRAADAAVRAGDRAGAAGDLARNAELINRAPGLMASPPVGEAQALLAEARELAGDDPAATARLLVAEASDGSSTDPAAVELIDRAILLARQLGDPLTESAALDQRTALQLVHGEIRAAAASALRRTELLAAVPATATAALEIFDSYGMATDCAIAAGDLRSARRLAEILRDLPFHREEGHLATARLLVVTTLTGEWDEAAALAERFRDGWLRAGRPRAGNLSRAPCAAAMVFGFRGDEPARLEWLEMVTAILTPDMALRDMRFGELFDSVLLLHRGDAASAVQALTAAPEDLNLWHTGLWRPWYAAQWAEAAVLAGSGDATDRLARARPLCADNPIATALLDRAAVLGGGGDRDRLAAPAAALQNSGCRYQWARTLVMMGGPERRQGEEVLASLGATPMVWPPAPC